MKDFEKKVIMKGVLTSVTMVMAKGVAGAGAMGLAVREVVVKVTAVATNTIAVRYVKG